MQAKSAAGTILQEKNNNLPLKPALSRKKGHGKSDKIVLKIEIKKKKTAHKK